MNEDRLLTIKEASEYLRLKPLSLYRMCEKKRIPFRKAGRSIRFIKSELEAWLRWGSL
jgi:excisionase family DNA binding protein